MRAHVVRENMSEISYESFPYGLLFYWYEARKREEHEDAWGQLCGSMHRLIFLRDEFENFKVIGDMDCTLESLAYHMENYLIRIYELRERAARLLYCFSKYQGKIDELKWKKSREVIVGKLNISESTTKNYLNLLSILDPDIALRNMNTHSTFLNLGFSMGTNVYNPHDVILDLSHNETGNSKFVNMLRKEIKRIVDQHIEKIEEIRKLTELCLHEMDFVRSVNKASNENKLEWTE